MEEQSSNKAMIFGIIVVILIIVGGLLVLRNGQEEVPVNESDIEQGHDADAMMEGEKMEDEGDSMMEGDKMEGEGDAMMQDAAQIIPLTGKNFSFSENEIRVKKGDKVTIAFESTDGFHDWVVDEFGAATERVSTGGKTEVTFTADKEGTFEYYCSVGNHRALGMVGNLIVESQ